MCMHVYVCFFLLLIDPLQAFVMVLAKEEQADVLKLGYLMYKLQSMILKLTSIFIPFK